MSQHAYEKLLNKRVQLKDSSESFPAQKYSVEDLDQEEIYKTVEDGIASGPLERSVIFRENIYNVLTGLELIFDQKITNATVVFSAY